MNKFERVINEIKNNRTMILYHGVDPKEGLDIKTPNEIKSGMWFYTSKDTNGMSFYGSRGGGIAMFEFTPTKIVADMLEYDVDDNLLEYELEDFIRDLLYHVDGLDYLDESYRIEDEIEPRFGEDEDYYTTSEIFNWIVREIIIPNKIPISAIKIKESGEETVVVFDKDELRYIKTI